MGRRPRGRGGAGEYRRRSGSSRDGNWFGPEEEYPVPLQAQARVILDALASTIDIGEGVRLNDVRGRYVANKHKGFPEVGVAPRVLRVKRPE